MSRIQPLIDVLDNDDVVRYASFKNHRIWPVVRFQVYQHIIDIENNLNKAGSGINISKWKVLIGIFNSIWKWPRKHKNVQVLFFTTALSLIKQKDGKFFNRVCDPYISLFDTANVCVVEESSNFIHPKPRVHNIHLYYKTIYNLLANLVTALNLLFHSKNVSDANREVELLLNRIFCLLKEHDRPLAADTIRRLQKSLLKSLLKIKPTLYLYGSLLKNSSIQSIFLEDGYYGNEKALINFTAHQLGIKVFEPQHGFINQNHQAYYYGSKYCADETIKKYYPDVLLTYGPYWSSVIRVPNEIAEIGNPNFEMQAKSYGDAVKEKSILVVGSGITVVETILVLKKLIELDSGYKIYYRPHPQERETHLSRYRDCYDAGILVDSGELYNSLSTKTIVIAEVSTVLFEAVAFCDYVFLLNSGYTRSCYDENVKYFQMIDVSDIDTIFEKKRVDRVAAMQYYWTTDWKSKFMNYA